MNREDENNTPAHRLAVMREAIDNERLSPIRRMLHSLHPAEIGQLLESLPQTERDILWQLVEPDDEGETLLHVNDEVRTRLLDGMQPQEIIAATRGLEVDDLADLLADIPDAVTEQILLSMSRLDRARLRDVLAYSEDTAGGLMNTDTVTVRPDVTVEVVLRYLRMHGSVPDGTDNLFVVNRYGTYLGTIYLARLLTNDPDRTVAELIDTTVAGILADTAASEVARLFADRDLVSAAVVDASGQLLGRITIDDVVDVIADQADHSMMSMAGLDEEDDMFAPVVTSARRRAVWLGVNLATAFLAAWVVGIFEATLQEVVALAVLMPVVASMGGVAGSQTLTLIIRGLALGRVGHSNARSLLYRETAVGLLNGAAWSLVVAAIAVLWFGSWRIGAIIAAAIAINLLAAAVAGVAIPLLLRRLGVDPALAGSVVLTTVTDVVGFLAFLGLGAIFLT